MIEPTILIGRLAVICCLLVVSITCATPVFAGSHQAETERKFQQWLKTDLKDVATKAGIPLGVYRQATSNIMLDWRLPDLAPPGSGSRPVAQKQSEFRPPGQYFNQRSINVLVKRGRVELKKWRRTFDRVEKKYGVPRRIIAAVWARESGYGRVKMPKNAIRSLATEAFIGRRRKLFQRELLAALKIVASGDIAASRMGSSWAGALGQPQFLPSNFHQYAVDFDGDGRRDIWNSVPDTLASIANYLAQHGWQRGRRWGYEATIPDSVLCSVGGPGSRQSIADWFGRGVNVVSGKPVSASERRERGYLLFPAGRHGPLFLTTPNFYVLKKYNNSDLYALFVGHLADRLKQNVPFTTGWQKLDATSRSGVQSMQEKLVARGYDVGGADGLIGYKTRNAIGKWQHKIGLSVTCFPDKALIRSLR